MIEDDDPKTAPAADRAPASEPDKASPPEGDKPEGDTEQTPSEDEQLAALADREAGDEDEDDGGDEGDEGDKKPERSRNQRRTEKIRRLQQENEQLRTARADGGIPAGENALLQEIDARVRAEIGSPPQPEQFRDAKGEVDYIAFHNEQQAYLNDRRAVTREVKRDMIRRVEAAQAHVANLVEAHKDRVAKFKTKVKDYDQVMAAATMPVAGHVERLLLNSNKSERLSYFLGRNQGKLAQLNRMDPEGVARELGRLEARLSLPPTKRVTQARKPVSPLRGGGASQTSQMAQVDAAMKKMYGDRYKP
jgi:hypothetical protein